MSEFITNNTKEFPNATTDPSDFCPKKPGFDAARNLLLEHGIRPAPERIATLAAMGVNGGGRKVVDAAFAACEGVTVPARPEVEGFDPGCPRLGPNEARAALAAVPENRAWIEDAVRRAGERFGMELPADAVDGAGVLLGRLCRHGSFWEADAFPLEAMMDLENRYGWTFSTDAWSLREQLRREAEVIRGAWGTLCAMAADGPLLVILNETTPTDYFTCCLPAGAALLNGGPAVADARVLVKTGVKISSSEHRDPLKDTPEGDGLAAAADLAEKTGRRPVLVDFSRRRFPRAFMRVARFAGDIGWGIDPVGKVLDEGAGEIPEAKSPRGFGASDGEVVISLFDPWPASDPAVVDGLDAAEKKAFCGTPETKPWQDDRIGARVEMEDDGEGNYVKVSDAWVVPALGGWVRADALFRSRLSRLLNSCS